MKKDIKFKKFDTEKCEIESADGEIALNYGCVVTENGAYGAGIMTKTQVKVPDGYRVLAIHNVGPYAQVILLSEDVATGTYGLHHASYEAEIKEAHIRDICRAGTVHGYEIMGHRIAIATDEGIMHLIWDSGYTSAALPPRMAGYRYIPAKLPNIEIEFGIQKAGQLASQDTIHTTTNAITNATAPYAPGSGASRPHPLANKGNEEKDHLSAAINDIYAEALRRQVLSKGYFHQPMLVRYALRLHDGSHIMPSSPVLLTPTVLPPRIVITSHTDGDDNATVSVDLSHNNYFQLRYRIPDMPPQQWQGIVAAIDIFATAPIPTYDDNADSDGCITSFQTVIETTDKAMSQRGRTPSRTSAEEIFEGHYSISNDIYTDHTLDENIGEHQTWYITPNQHLADDIIGAHIYYKIASIPYADIEGMAQYREVPLLTSDLSAIKTHPVLEDTHPQRQILASVLSSHGGRLIIGAHAYRLSSPCSLRSMSAFAGASADPALAATISVYAVSDGKMHRTTCQKFAHPAPLTEQFPRYLYYPDPNAIVMTIEQDSNRWTLPLTRHDRLPGAYWWGGLDKCPAPESRSSEETADTLTDMVSRESKVYVTAESNPFKITGSTNIGPGEIHGIICAQQAPKGGTYGTYPLYAIGSEGVWMLRYTDSKGQVTAARLISETGSLSALGIVSMGDKVVYAGKCGIYQITSSDVKEISTVLRHMHFDIGSLPYSADLLLITKAVRMEIDTEEFFNECRLTYMPDHKLLIVSSGVGVNFAYHTEQGIWGLTDVVLHGNIGGTRHLALSPDGCAVSLCPSTGNSVTTTGIGCDKGAPPSLLVTRALKLGTEIEARDVRSIEVLGDFRDETLITVLYGADRLGCWHLIGSRKGGAIRDVNGSRYRYHRVVVIARLQPGEYIYGIQAEY